MPYRTLLLAAATAAFAFAAQAQDAENAKVPAADPPASTIPATPAAPAAAAAAAPSSATVGAAFRVETMVKDAVGGDVGVIQSIADGPGGPQLVIQIDGVLFGLPQSEFTATADGAVSKSTKAQIKAAAFPGH